MSEADNGIAAVEQFNEDAFKRLELMAQAEQNTGPAVILQQQAQREAQLMALWAKLGQLKLQQENIIKEIDQLAGIHNSVQEATGQPPKKG